MSDARIAIFASGSGTNAERIIRYFQNHKTIRVALVLCNNETAYVLDRAKQLNVPLRTFNRKQFREKDEVLNWLVQNKITHIVLAGFMWLMPESIINHFPERIINIHPALLPKFGGRGMYGHHVHKAVKEANEIETGITIHQVNEKYDDGKILFQASCSISPGDSPEQIAEKVHALEYSHYPTQIEKWILNNNQQLEDYRIIHS